MDVDDDFDCSPLDLMADTMTDFCACSDDMCNTAMAAQGKLVYVLFVVGALAMAGW